MVFYWRNGAWQPRHDWSCSRGASWTLGSPWAFFSRGTYIVGPYYSYFATGFTVDGMTQFCAYDLVQVKINFVEFYMLEYEAQNGIVSRGCAWMSAERVVWMRENVTPGTYVVVH